MADIEPYKQIKKTNIQEHNDLVGKINEIIEVINQTNLETIVPKISKLEQDVSAINATDALQWNDIESIKNKNTEQDSALATHTTEIDGITKSLVSDVVLMNGATVGNMKVRIEREDAPSIDSDDYNIQKPTSVELVQGSAPAMVKAQITLSDGTVLISDDFMFTTESIGQDVYISSFVFKNGNVAGTISADIGLSNGTTLTANNFVVPTDPNVTTAISDLQSRVSAVEGGSVGGLDELKATVDNHTASIEALDNDVADMMVSKADVDNINQSIRTGVINVYSFNMPTGTPSAVNPDSCAIAVNESETGKLDTNKPLRAIRSYYDDFAGDYISEPLGNVALLNDDGSPKNFTAGGGGEVWEEVDLSNFPTDWVDGDRFKIMFKGYVQASAPSWTSEITTVSFVTSETYVSNIIELEVRSNNIYYEKIVRISYDTSSNAFGLFIYRNPPNVNSINGTGMGNIYLIGFNGSGYKTGTAISLTGKTVLGANLTTYISKMWRLKK